MSSNKMNTKDLILAGAFIALYVVALSVIVTIFGFIPVTYLMVPFFLPICMSPIFALYVTKVPRFGAILALGIAVTLVANMTGGVLGIVCSIAAVVVAELIAKSGNYQSKKKYAMAYFSFSFTNIGPFWTLVVAKDSMINACATFYGQEYADQLASLTPSWIIFVFIGMVVVGAIIGNIFAPKVMKKHFEKAGII